MLAFFKIERSIYLLCMLYATVGWGWGGVQVAHRFPDLTGLQYTVHNILDENPAITGLPWKFQIYLDFYLLDTYPEQTGNPSKIWKSIQILLEDDPTNFGITSKLAGLSSSNIWKDFQTLEKIPVNSGWISSGQKSRYSWKFRGNPDIAGFSSEIFLDFFYSVVAPEAELSILCQIDVAH